MQVEAQESEAKIITAMYDLIEEHQVPAEPEDIAAYQVGIPIQWASVQLATLFNLVLSHSHRE